MLAQLCNAFLIRFSEFRHLITLEFAWPVFPWSPLLKATDDMFSQHTAFVCDGNRCSEGLSSHVQFSVSVPTLQAGPVKVSLSACTCVSFFWPSASTRFAPNSRLCIRGICPFQNEWIQKTRAHLIRKIRWKTKCWISSTWHSSD